MSEDRVDYRQQNRQFRTDEENLAAQVESENQRERAEAEKANQAAAVALAKTRTALIVAEEYKGPRDGAEATAGQRMLSYCDPITDRHRKYSQAMCEETGMLSLAAANTTLTAQGKKPLDANEVETIISFLISKNVWAGDLSGDAIIAGLTCLIESHALRTEIKRVVPKLKKVPAVFDGDPILNPDAYSKWQREQLKAEQDEQDIQYIQESPAWLEAITSICTTANKTMDWASALRLLEVFRQMQAESNRSGRNPMAEDVAGIRRAATALWGNIGELSVERGEKAFGGLTAEEQRSLLNSADQRDPRLAQQQWHSSRTMRQN